VSSFHENCENRPILNILGVFQQVTQRTQCLTSSLVVECKQEWNDSLCYTVSSVSLVEKRPLSFERIKGHRGVLNVKIARLIKNGDSRETWLIPREIIRFEQRTLIVRPIKARSSRSHVSRSPISAGKWERAPSAFLEASNGSATSQPIGRSTASEFTTLINPYNWLRASRGLDELSLFYGQLFNLPLI